MGADNLVNFHKWNDWKKIPKLATIAVFSRQNYSTKSLKSIASKKLCESDFVNLNTKPLGQLIFNDKRFKRMPFEITNMCSSKAFLEELHITSEIDLWGRRSAFRFENLKMTVSEVFLPSSPAYQEMK